MNNDLYFINKFNQNNDTLIVLQQTKKIMKDDLLEWKNFQENYFDAETSIDRALISIINSILYQRRIYFVMTREKIQTLVKNDKNQINKNVGFDNGSWPAILAKGYQSKVFKFIKKGTKNGTRKGVASVFKLINPELIKYIKIDEKIQLTQCIDFVTFKDVQDKVQDKVQDTGTKLNSKEGNELNSLNSKEGNELNSKEGKEAYSNKELSTKPECKMSLSEEIKLDSYLVSELMIASIKTGNPNYSEYKTFTEYKKLLEEIYNTYTIRNVNEKKLIIDFILQSARKTLNAPSFKKLEHSAKMKKGTLISKNLNHITEIEN